MDSGVKLTLSFIWLWSAMNGNFMLAVWLLYHWTTSWIMHVDILTESCTSHADHQQLVQRSLHQWHATEDLPQWFTCRQANNALHAVLHGIYCAVTVITVNSEFPAQQRHTTVYMQTMQQLQLFSCFSGSMSRKTAQVPYCVCTMPQVTVYINLRKLWKYFTNRLKAELCMWTASCKNKAKHKLLGTAMCQIQEQQIHHINYYYSCLVQTCPGCPRKSLDV